MNDAEYRAFLDLLRRSDPWPVADDGVGDVLLTNFADDEARKRGFDNWVVAYHEHDRSGGNGAMSDIKEKLRTFEGSDALGDGDFSLLHEAADHITALESKLAAAEAERDRLQMRILTAPTTRPRPQPDPAYGQITCVTRPEDIGKRVALVVLEDGE